MMWHLCDVQGVSQKVCSADDMLWARRALSPIPSGWFVVSDPSYHVGWHKSHVPEACSKCFRYAPAEGSTKCEMCRKRDRESTRRVLNNRKRERDRERKRREANTRNGHKAAQGNIARGIARRAEKRAQESGAI